MVEMTSNVTEHRCSLTEIQVDFWYIYGIESGLFTANFSINHSDMPATRGFCQDT